MPLHFFASELQLRGMDVAKQPHLDVDRKNIFCWNGEVREWLVSRGLIGLLLTTSVDIRGDGGSTFNPL